MTDAQDAAARKRIAEYQQPLSLEAQKLAIWDELVEALDECITRLWQAGHAIDSHMNNLPDRARALRGK